MKIHCNKIDTGIRMLVINIFLIVAAFALPASSTSINIGNFDIVSGSSVNGTLMLNDVNNFGGGDITISYDPSVVIISNIKPTNPLIFLNQNINNATGLTTINAEGPFTGLTGDIIIADITFKAVGTAGSSSAINITANLIDASFFDIPTTPINGTINVTAQILKYILIQSSTTNTLTVGQTHNFNSTALDQNDNPMAGVDISWTVSNLDIGSVIPIKSTTDANGNASTMFIASNPGNAMVNATNESVTGTAIVTVENIPLPSTGPVHNINSGKSYTTIQAAIDDASLGDEIHVDSGTYNENVNVNKRIILRGLGLPVVNAGGSGNAITLAADGIILEGFSLTGIGNLGAGIKVISSNNTLLGNTASSNSGLDTGYGIYLLSSNNNTLTSNIASGNFGNIYGIGIVLDHSSDNILTSNTALNNSGNDNGYGIYLYDSSNNNTLTRNIVSNNFGTNNQAGIFLSTSNNNKIYNNIFNNTNNIQFSGSNVNSWNTTMQYSPNIIGGTYLGGNFWAHPDGTGFSLECSDINGDGICNDPYTLDSNNVDNLPLSAIVPVVQNVILNPGFESDRMSWLFYTNGTGTFTATSPGYEGTKAAKIALSSRGTNVQLYQKDILLEPNTRYRLSFAAYSTDGHDLTVNLIKHGSPYTNYGLVYTANLGTDWQMFTTEFTTKGFEETVNDGRLMFWLAPFAAAEDRYYIDNVILEIVPVAPAITRQPSNRIVNVGQTATFTVVATGSAPLAYQWQKNGVDIPGAINASYTTLPTALSDSNSTFSVIVTNSLDSANSNDASLIVWPGVSNNLIENSGFESETTSWLFYTNGTGTFIATSPGYEGTKVSKITLSSRGTNVQLYQKDILLEPNTRYRLSFAAYSTDGHDLTVNLIKHGSPYTNYGLVYKANPGTDWQMFTTEFTTKGFADTVNDGRLMFWLAPFAKAGDRYYIDNVRLEKINFS